MNKNKKTDWKNWISGVDMSDDPEFVAMHSWANLVKRMKVLGGLLIGVIIVFMVMGMSSVSFESVVMIVLMTLILYLPFRISFSIDATFGTRVVIGLVLFFLMLGISELSNLLFLVIALGAVAIDVGIPLSAYISASKRKGQ